MTVDIDEVEKDIIRRDEQDMNREFAPLRCADDAIYLDTTEMSAEKVLEFAIKKVKEVYGNEILSGRSGNSQTHNQVFIQDEGHGN